MEIDLNNLPMFNPLNREAYVPGRLIEGALVTEESVWPKTKGLRDYTYTKPGYGRHTASSYTIPDKRGERQIKGFRSHSISGQRLNT
jgi:hypothetical protein